MKTLVLGAQGMLGRDLMPLSTDDNTLIGLDIEDCRIENLQQVTKAIADHQPDRGI